MYTPVTRLFVTFFPSEGNRLQELYLCLSLNEAAFDYVYVLSDGAPKPEWSTATWHVEGHRHRMSEAFGYINSVAGSQDISVVANTDIIIPKRSVTTIRETLGDKECYCLSKWDITPSKGIRPWYTGWSQDTWCFRGRVACQAGDYHFGLPGCDNRLAYELSQHYQVLNPSYSIPTYHLHLSNVRTETNNEPNRVPAPYLLVTPHHLGENAEHHIVPEHHSTRNHFNALW